jgi:hypothetical protein
VYFHSDQGKITYVGKPQNINEAKELIKELTTEAPQGKE